MSVDRRADRLHLGPRHRHGAVEAVLRARRSASTDRRRAAFPSSSSARTSASTSSTMTSDRQRVPRAAHVVHRAARAGRARDARRSSRRRASSSTARRSDTGVCHMAFFRDPDGNQMMLHRRYAPTTHDAHADAHRGREAVRRSCPCRRRRTSTGASPSCAGSPGGQVPGTSLGQVRDEADARSRRRRPRRRHRERDRDRLARPTGSPSSRCRRTTRRS